MSSIFWVKRAANLKRRKQLWLLRCAGLSLHYLSPAHPVLAAVVYRIGLETSGATAFKNFERYLDMHGKEAIDFHMRYPTEFKVDRRMRDVVDRGAIGFPPISMVNQFELEERICKTRSPNIYVGRMLDGYEDFDNNVKAFSKPDSPAPSKDIVKLFDILENVVENPSISMWSTNRSVSLP